MFDAFGAELLKIPPHRELVIGEGRKEYVIPHRPVLSRANNLTNSVQIVGRNFYVKIWQSDTELTQAITKCCADFQVVRVT